MYSINEVSKKLLVTRNCIVKKKEKLKEKKYLIENENKKRDKYIITNEGYEFLKRERIKELEKEIKQNPKMKEYYNKLLENIGNEEKYEEIHFKEFKSFITVNR